MEINADFSKPAFVHTETVEWVPSPMKGVDRRMLDRIGGEVARATSIVRYAEGSAFPEHTHSGGEEFIVLDGTFQDEHGDYPAGTYVRNPVGTHHVPRADQGCTIFVKLWQFDPEDQEHLTLDLNTLDLSPDLKRPGVSHATLAQLDYEDVALERWERGTSFEISASGGFEILVLDGSISLMNEDFGRHDWIRIPAEDAVKITSGPEGARIWVKRGHLDNVTAPAQVA